jgi:hypothetical protein
MKKMINGWNVMRVVRLLIGIAALVQGVLQKENLLLVAGLWILFSAVFNVGCCGSGGCTIQSSSKKPTKDVVYEELGVPK